jgi:outer membrane lipoprotein-sorting protein
MLRFALALALLPAAAGALTVDEVVDRHVAAHGGLDRWRAVKSMVITGTQVLFSDAKPFTLTRARPNLYRFDHEMLGHKMVFAYDGEKSWWVFPLMEVPEPAAAAEPQATHTRREAEFESVLIDHQAKGHKVELLGQEEVDGQPALKLKVTLKDGSEETWYLDPKTFLEVARVNKTVDLTQEAQQWTYFSDFRTVEGLVIPHRLDREYSIRHAALVIEKVQVNPTVDPGLFKMPVPKAPAPAKP